LKNYCDDQLKEIGETLYVQARTECRRQYDHSTSLDQKSFWSDVEKQIRAGKRFDDAVLHEAKARHDFGWYEVVAMNTPFDYWKAI
jgi:hypothetical protein